MTGGHGRRAGRRLDLARLPDDVVALIEGLGPGEELVLTRDGEPVATVTGAARGVLGRVVVEADGADDEGAEDDAGRDDVPGPTADGVTVVATALRLSKAARRSLADRLGPDYVVLDMDDAPRDADVLLIPPAVSLQLIGNLRAMFPTARVVAAEVEDPDLKVRHRGPLHRLREAGVEAYLATGSVAQLAGQLDRTVTARPELAAGGGPRVELGPAGEL